MMDRPIEVAPSGVWRAFIAVDIGHDMRQALARLQDELRRTHPDIKWVLPENIHLTLAFLGDVFPGHRDSLTTGLDSVAGTLRSFTCTVEGLGTFGPPNSPRVVWAGIRQGADQLITMQANVAAMVRQTGLIPEDRAFHPHLTLARVKFPRTARYLEERLAKLATTPFGTISVNSIQLMQSTLRPDGPVYTVVHQSSLLG